jgi:hypothetical protein
LATGVLVWPTLVNKQWNLPMLIPRPSIISISSIGNPPNIENKSTSKVTNHNKNLQVCELTKSIYFRSVFFNLGIITICSNFKGLISFVLIKEHSPGL